MDPSCRTLTKEETDKMVDVIRNATTILSLWASKLAIGRTTAPQRQEIYTSIRKHTKYLEEVAEQLDRRPE